MVPYDAAAARLEAMAAADQLHRELAVDVTKPIDIFAVIEDLGIWLGFKPLANVLGVYRTEGSGGVLITTRRDTSVQRYTAAHELGHWRLDTDDSGAIDDDSTIYGGDPVEREYLAQAFAAYFLMPPPAVFAAIGRLGLTGELSPSRVYAVSRELGASYEATVRHLHRLGMYDYRRQGELLSVPRLNAVTELAHGMRPLDGRADVWIVDERWNGQRLSVTERDQVVISLPESPSTGSRWMSVDVMKHRRTGTPAASVSAAAIADPHDENADGHQSTNPAARLSRTTARTAGDLTGYFGHLTNSAAALRVTDTVFEPPRGPVGAEVIERRRVLSNGGAAREPLVGGVGRRLIAMTATRSGEHRVRLQYARPFGTGVAQGAFEIAAAVQSRRADFSKRQSLGLAAATSSGQLDGDDD